jgi:V/A-type H+/Na+-transporting ATPase subunit C
MSHMSNNVILAKAKAMYGSFLQKDDYERLSKLSSSPEIVFYLKKHPYYQSILKDVSANTIHRGQLELLIRKCAFDQIIKLVDSIYSEDKPFYELAVLKQENELILSVLRTIISDEPQLMRGMSQYFFTAHTKLDLKSLFLSEDFDDLLKALEHTPFYDVIKPYYSKNKDFIKYLDIEFALDRYFYDEVFKRMTVFYKGEVLRALRSFYSERIELSNIVKIYRLKKFYEADPKTIKQLLNIEYGMSSEHKLDQLIASSDPNHLLHYIAKNQVVSKSSDYVYVEYYAGMMKYKQAKKIMYFSTDIPLFFSAFMQLSDIQSENITNIIEGIRYQVSEIDVKSMLIYE